MVLILEGPDLSAPGHWNTDHKDSLNEEALNKDKAAVRLETPQMPLVKGRNEVNF